jgi:hypothetical protein
MLGILTQVVLEYLMPVSTLRGVLGRMVYVAYLYNASQIKYLVNAVCMHHWQAPNQEQFHKRTLAAMFPPSD